MAHCEEYIELISAAIDGALSPAEREKLTAHLSTCPECQALYDQLTSLHTAMAELPPVAVPAGLKDRIMDAVAAEKVVPLAPGKKTSIHWQRWLASAAVLALVLVGTWSWKPWENQTGDSSADLSAPAAPFLDQGAPGTGGGTQDVPETAAITSDVPAEESQNIPMVRTAEPGTVTVEPNADAAPTDPAPAPSTHSTDTTSAVTQTKEADGGDREEVSPAERGESFPEDVPATIGLGDSLGLETYGGGGDSTQPASTFTPFLVPFASDPIISVPATAPESGEAVRSEGLTLQDAAWALANYIYEFVDNVEPLEDGSFALTSPTGAAGTATCVGEDESVFFLDYQDSFSLEVLHYTVNKGDGAVKFLGRETAPEGVAAGTEAPPIVSY